MKILDKGYAYIEKLLINVGNLRAADQVPFAPALDDAVGQIIAAAGTERYLI